MWSLDRRVREFGAFQARLGAMRSLMRVRRAETLDRPTDE
jgi:hypothetical protein